MADKPKKKRKDERGVLAALPAERPARIGTRRATAPKTFAPGEAAASAAEPSAKRPPAKPAKRRAPADEAAKPHATAARRKAAAPRTFEPTRAAETAAGAADERSAGAPVTPAREDPPSYPRPRPVREGAPGIGTAGYRKQQPAERSGRPSGSELAGNAVKAAGELAQVGVTIGGQLLKRALERVPRP
jgi:hypothetical protein